MKRLFDVIFSLLALILLSPLLAVIALTVAADSGFPIIFRQKRVGYHDELFEIRKFRTMKTGTRRVATSKLNESSERITRVGRFLRKTSLDELPQLVNILEGSMSFVGPRPLIPEESKIRRLRRKYDIYSVRPGITGLAQISGRDHLGIEKKTEFDREYVLNQSLRLDIKIIFKTFRVVLRGENIAEGGK